jgi:NitT/TauT family transport system permease protein
MNAVPDSPSLTTPGNAPAAAVAPLDAPPWWDAWLSPVLLVVLLALWEAGVRVFGVSPIILPAPSAVAAALFDGFSNGFLLRHFGVTLFETLAGFAAGAIAGLLLGALIAQSRLAERVLYPYVIAFQAVPKVAIAPLVVIWFGYGLSSKVVIAATIAFFPVLANTIVGLRAVPADQLELMSAFMATRTQVLWKLRLPQALPFILVGLDVGAVLAVIGAVVGEFVSAKEGLGFQILQAGFAMNTAGVFAALVLLALLGIAISRVMRVVRRQVLHWAEDADPMQFNG